MLKTMLKQLKSLHSCLIRVLEYSTDKMNGFRI